MAMLRSRVSCLLSVCGAPIEVPPQSKVFLIHKL